MVFDCLLFSTPARYRPLRWLHNQTTTTSATDGICYNEVNSSQFTGGCRVPDWGRGQPSSPLPSLSLPLYRRGCGAIWAPPTRGLRRSPSRQTFSWTCRGSRERWMQYFQTPRLRSKLTTFLALLRVTANQRATLGIMRKAMAPLLPLNPTMSQLQIRYHYSFI